MQKQRRKAKCCIHVKKWEENRSINPALKYKIVEYPQPKGQDYSSVKKNYEIQ